MKERILGLVRQPFSTPLRRRRVATATASVAGLVLVGSFLQPWSTTSYDAAGSTVWVTKEDAFGRLNTQTGEIDVAVGAANPVIRQDGQVSYLVTAGADTKIQRLDAGDPVAEGRTAEVAGSAVVAVGGGVVAARDGSGAVTRVGVDGSFPVAGDVDMKIGAKGLIAVGPDGTLAGFDPERGRLYVLAPGDDDAVRHDLDKTSETAQLAVVGRRAVVLDVDEGRLLTDDGKEIDLGDRPSPVLQLSGPKSSQVLVADDDELTAFDLDGGGSNEVSGDGSGAAIRPAAFDSCTYAAWKGTGDSGGSAEVRCGSDGPITADLGGGDQWVWRVGGPQPVLNEVQTGRGFVEVDGELQAFGPWPNDRSDESPSTTVDVKPPNPAGTHKPVATDDTKDERVGARPGRITQLAVLRNDYDEDGDTIYVAGKLGDVEAKPLSISQGGRAVQIDLREWKKGDPTTFTFTYQVADGPGQDRLSKPAKVEVQVVTGEGAAPQLIPQQALAFAVPANGASRYEVLSAFWDPDGDPIYLTDVEDPPYGHSVTYTPDGWIRFAAAARVGQVPLGITVKDSTGKAADASTVSVDVVDGASGQAPPELRNDFVTARVGERTVIEPLANDVDPNGDAIRITKVKLIRPSGSDDALGLKRDGDRVDVTPASAGDFVIRYDATDDSGTDRSSVATIVVRVTDPRNDAPPEPLADVVQVETGRTASVDLLANDTDPLDRMLAVSGLRLLQSTDDTMAEQELAQTVERDLRTFSVDALPGAEPGLTATYTYRVTNGRGISEATVTVVVVANSGNRLPQIIAPPPRVKVRAGDAATVPISSIAKDPDGDPLTIEVTNDLAVGDASAGGGSVRYFAPAGAKRQDVRIDLEVSEPTGSSRSAAVIMEVVPEGTNTKPTAKPLEARVRQGRSVVIPVPTIGLDADGDAVSVAGRSDTKAISGLVTLDASTQSFTYTATDRNFDGPAQFEYQLVDEKGMLSDPATVRVLVVKPERENSSPVAVTDRVLARPNAEVWVDPVANDTDIDGDALELVDEELVAWPKGCSAKVEGDKVRVKTSDVDCTVQYHVQDTVPDRDGNPSPRGAPDDGFIGVTVLEDYPGRPPLARDDYPSPTKDEKVSVPILANDDDPDGSIDALSVKPIDAPLGTKFTKKGGLLEVPVADQPSIVRYRITDGDGLSSEAVVRVPGKEQNQPPVMGKVPKLKVKVDAKKPAEYELKEFITDPENGRVTFDAASSARFQEADLTAGVREGKLRLMPLNTQFVGDTTVTVRATDSAAQPLSKVFTIPVTIEPGENRPPEWTGDPCGEIPRNAGATVTINAAAAVEELDPNDVLTFKGGGSAKGLKTSVASNGTMTATVEDVYGSKTGDRVPVDLEVSDGKDSAVASCSFTMTRNTSAPLRASNVSKQGNQGEPISVDVRPLVANAAGSKLELVGTPAIETGKGSGSMSASGTTFTYTSKPDFAGDVTVRYTVTDKVDEGADRQSSAVVTIRVVGKPDKPTGVTAVAKDGTVTVSVGGVDANFSEITGYDVRSVSPAGGWFGCSMPCSVPPAKLVMGTPHTFQVRAKNAVGTGPESDPSNPAVTPDVDPSAPKAGDPIVPVAAKGSSTVQVTFGWSAGPEKGSKVKGYLVDGEFTTGTTATRPGLTGGEVCVEVKAQNSTDRTSPPTKMCATPYGPPVLGPVFSVDADVSTATVTLQSVHPGATGGLTWTARGCKTVSAIADAITVSGCGAPGKRTITLTATNSKGLSAEVSTEVTFGKPPSISGDLKLEWGDYADGVYPVTGITWPTIDDGGAVITSCTITVNGSTFYDDTSCGLDAPDGWSFTPGTTLSVVLTVTNAVDSTKQPLTVTSPSAPIVPVSIDEFQCRGGSYLVGYSGGTAPYTLTITINGVSTVFQTYDASDSGDVSIGDVISVLVSGKDGSSDTDSITCTE